MSQECPPAPAPGDIPVEPESVSAPSENASATPEGASATPASASADPGGSPATDADDATAPTPEKGASPIVGGVAGLFVPGLVQLRRGERTKGFLYLFLGLGTLTVAFAGNRLWLYLLWKLKALNVTRVFLHDYYAAKQHALYLFGFLYLILLVASRVDAMINPCDGQTA